MMAKLGVFGKSWKWSKNKKWGEYLADAFVKKKDHCLTRLTQCVAKTEMARGRMSSIVYLIRLPAIYMATKHPSAWKQFISPAGLKKGSSSSANYNSLK